MKKGRGFVLGVYEFCNFKLVKVVTFSNKVISDFLISPSYGLSKEMNNLSRPHFITGNELRVAIAGLSSWFKSHRQRWGYRKLVRKNITGIIITVTTYVIHLKCYYDQKIISFFPSDFERVFA